jgi:hypothetical protein
MRKGYWVLSRDTETTELRFSKCFFDQDDAESYLPWYRDRAAEEVWKSPAIVTLETLAWGELPKMRLSASASNKGPNTKTSPRKKVTEHKVGKKRVARQIKRKVIKPKARKPAPRKRGPSK